MGIVELLLPAALQLFAFFLKKKQDRDAWVKEQNEKYIRALLKLSMKSSEEVDLYFQEKNQRPD